jgi:cobalt-zinc-cadmium efflux system outer membrane protein
MMGAWTPTALLSLAFVLPLRLEGQDPTRTDTVLARLTAEAVAANAGLSADQARAHAATARIRAAGALPDPMLNTGVMDLTLPGFAFHESDFTEVDIELSQEFPWFGTLGARTRAASAEARMRGADVRTRQRDIVVRTAELYYRLRYLVGAQAILARQRSLLEAGVEISTTRYATGSVGQSDPLQARVARARLDTEAAALAAEEAGLRADVKALRNIRSTDSLPVQPIDAESVYVALERSEVHRMAEQHDTDSLLVEHPRLESRRAAIEAAEATARVEALGARPDFTVGTRYGARPLGSDFFSAFVGVRLPLWAGRKQHRLADAARDEAVAARSDLADETQALTAELTRVRSDAEAGRVRLQLLVTQVVPSAEMTAEAALRSYRVGQVDFLNVLAVDDALYRARLDAVQVAAEHLTHLVMLRQLLAVGGDQ